MSEKKKVTKKKTPASPRYNWSGNKGNTPLAR